MYIYIHIYIYIIIDDFDMGDIWVIHHVLTEMHIQPSTAISSASPRLCRCEWYKSIHSRRTRCCIGGHAAEHFYIFTMDFGDRNLRLSKIQIFASENGH